MNEFSLIETYFASLSSPDPAIVLGIGDDAACLQVPDGMDLLVSTDTLIEGVHFLPQWNAEDIAYRALMVNVSDIAAMAGTPTWATLALTMPTLNESWLSQFSQGLRAALSETKTQLVGGDTTKGPMSLTITIHGLVPHGYCVTRKGAQLGDQIYVTGPLGGASFALQQFRLGRPTTALNCLLRPKARTDWVELLRQYANAAIDISDGLSSDLSHILSQSRCSAIIELSKIPIHSEIPKDDVEEALAFALSGGDDYEICLTVASKQEPQFLAALKTAGLTAYHIGVISEGKELLGRDRQGHCRPIQAMGYRHF